ncbi:hypothetical protein ABZS66_61410, partial [Dactylosporangium sp. NPDC005572]|uniref:hypothetical protein n=1 Tax=Dactylosporangium sp. NPDC005572 TaxID=3156889 RepID=UPI0033BC480B
RHPRSVHEPGLLHHLLPPPHQMMILLGVVKVWLGFFRLVGFGLVAFVMVMVWSGGGGLWWARLSFQFDILRLITRGLVRGRRVMR